MVYDIVIIGAGPAGLTAGIYARSKMMNTLILDSGKVGGQLVALYPQKGVHNYPGFETIQARKLSDKLYAQAESMDCEIHEDEAVEEIINGDGDLIVKTVKNEYHALSVVVAIGMGKFTPKHLDVPGESEMEGKGVSYILPMKEELVGRKVVVFGGGNSAIEMALISDSVTDTTLVHRRDTFRADEINVKNLNNSQIRVMLNSAPKSFNGTDRLESITMVENGKEVDVPADLAVVNIGISADLTILRKWNLDLTEKGYVKVKEDMSTNRPGIFACGDVVDYPGKYMQIITACGEAATATVSAYKFAKKPYWARRRILKQNGPARGRTFMVSVFECGGGAFVHAGTTVDALGGVDDGDVVDLDGSLGTYVRAGSAGNTVGFNDFYDHCNSPWEHSLLTGILTLVLLREN